MELLQLHYFQESATNGSFAKTAQAHSVPATSVSAAVKRLENELGCALFDRTCNRIQLNENGKLFLKTVDEVLRKLEHATYILQPEVEDDRQICMPVRTKAGKSAAPYIHISKRWDSLFLPISRCHQPIPTGGSLSYPFLLKQNTMFPQKKAKIL